MKLELVEGLTLEEWGLQPGRTLGEVVDRVLEVSRGLAVAHDARVVHRDVKEDNILVREGDGQAVLVDFGAGYHEGDATLTKGMFPPGAPLYRAPEAWAFGRAHAGEPGAHYRAGPGDDLYALGVVFYRLLTGRFPFRLTDEGGVDVEAVLHRAPLPPHLVNPRVPREVEAVCLRLLEKRPEARYPSAVALYEALETLKAGADAAWTVPLHGETSSGRQAAERGGPGCWRGWAWGWPWHWGAGGSALARKWRLRGSRRNLHGPWPRLPRCLPPRSPPHPRCLERTMPP